jgi:WD40 repeat protein
MVRLRNGNICSGNNYGAIKLWDSTTGVCEMTLIGHTDWIDAIVIIDDVRMLIKLLEYGIVVLEFVKEL